MNLKEFISTVLKEIAEGMLEADTALSNTTDAVVNPAEIQVNTDKSQAYGRTLIEGAQNQDHLKGSRIVERVEFDVAVTVEDSTKGGGGLKLAIMSVGIGAQAESGSRTAAESRVKFGVPMVFPSRQPKLENQPRA